jgi:flavodoxin
VVIVFDSVFGNTQKIAEAIRDGFVDLKAACRIVHAEEAGQKALEGADLILFGSPTRAFRPMPTVLKVLHDKTVPLEQRKVAVFDTRSALTGIKSKLLKFMVEKLGYAAPVMVQKLVSRHAILIREPEGFCVTAAEGPLVRGEAERAFLWAKTLAEALK